MAEMNGWLVWFMESAWIAGLYGLCIMFALCAVATARTAEAWFKLALLLAGCAVWVVVVRLGLWQPGGLSVEFGRKFDSIDVAAALSGILLAQAGFAYGWVRRLSR